MSRPFLSRIRIYPIKACAGVDVQEAYIDERGLRYDRRWMLINDHGADLHQFDYPRLASVVVALAEDHLEISAPAMPLLCISLQIQVPHAQSVVVRWYEGTCEAIPASDAADAWFQTLLGVVCRLVFMPEGAEHRAGVERADHHDLAAFTSFQYHLLGEGSLADLNQRLETPVPLERFRPNLVVAGVPPFAEDAWRVLRIGDRHFQAVKPCDRCAITTVDPLRGVMTGKEPLTTLARYRTFDHNVLFGQYLLSGETGVVRIGDTIEVMDFQEPPRWS